MFIVLVALFGGAGIWIGLHSESHPVAGAILGGFTGLWLGYCVAKTALENE